MVGEAVSEAVSRFSTAMPDSAARCTWYGGDGSFVDLADGDLEAIPVDGSGPSVTW